MQAAELVAVRIAQICEIQLAVGNLANAGRIFYLRSAGTDPGAMPGIHFVGTVEQEADGTAIGWRSRVTIERPGDHESGAILAIGEPALVIDRALLAEQGVVE